MKRTTREAAKTPACRRYDNRLTDLERAMVARRETGATRKTISEEFGVTVEMVRRAEWRAHNDAEGRKLLVADSESLEGLRLVGELGYETQMTLACHHYHYDGPELARLSDVAAVGRSYVMGLEGMGPKRMAALDSLLERFGLKWNPEPRPLRPRRAEPAQSTQYDASEIVAAIRQLQMRVAYLEGYTSERARLRDRQPEPEAEPVASDLERAGNLVCFPGVTLASIKGSDDSGARQ